MKQILLSVGALALLALASGFTSQDPKPAPAPKPTPEGKPAPEAKPAAAPAAKAPTNAEVIAAQRPSYPLDTCPVSGKPLGKDAVDNVKDGHLVRTCCGNCTAKIDAAAIKKVDDAVIAAQLKSYPMENCLCGAKLGDKTVNHVVGTRLVRCCTPECASMMDKDPKAAMAKLDRAYIDTQLKTYKLKTCPVSGEELGKMGEPVNYLYGTTLVRFCCKDCVKDMQKDPDAVLKKLAAAK